MKVVLLPGDGIGPEVTGAAREILGEIAPDLELEDHVFGGAAILETGTPLPDETLAACTVADAVLLGAVGLPQFDGADVRPEQGLLGLRKSLGVYANLRPASSGEVDLLVVRELVGGLYFGARGTREDGTVFDTMEYHPDQVARIARRAFELAGARRGRVCSVDKANVLDTSRMWRRVVTGIGAVHPDVELEHLLVDTVAMRLVTDAQHFDVILTENMFGDILSDEASAVTGGLGLAASASLSDDGPGIFEPVHGSAPDIAGRGIANPAAMLRSVALMLDYAFGRHEDARRLEGAVGTALTRAPTPDLGGGATTADATAATLAALAR